MPISPHPLRGDVLTEATRKEIMNDDDTSMQKQPAVLRGWEDMTTVNGDWPLTSSTLLRGGENLPADKIDRFNRKYEHHMRRFAKNRYPSVFAFAEEEYRKLVTWLVTSPDKFPLYDPAKTHFHTILIVKFRDRLNRLAEKATRHASHAAALRRHIANLVARSKIETSDRVHLARFVVRNLILPTRSGELRANGHVVTARACQVWAAAIHCEIDRAEVAHTFSISQPTITRDIRDVNAFIKAEVERLLNLTVR